MLPSSGCNTERELNPKQMVRIMSQAHTNIGPVEASYKTTPRPTQRQTDARRTQPGTRRTISADQRAKLSVAQLAYIANDPRWVEHRRKLAAVQDAKRMTLFENEVTAILAMRKDGQAFSYIAKIGVSRDVIRRELALLGVETGRVKAKPMTLFENEVTAILAMRKQGRTFSYIEQEIGVSRDVIRRELALLGVETGRVKSDRRARPGKGFWRSFD